MLKGKKLYVVKGSEDGIVGIYTTIKAAYNRAVEYAGNGKPSYPDALKAMKRSGWFEISEPNARYCHNVHAVITEHFLNE